MLQRVLELKEEMFVLLTTYGKLRPELYSRLFNDIETFDEVVVDKLYGELLNFRNFEYAELYRIFRLPLDNSSNGPEYWDRILRYDHPDIKFPEVRLLNKQARVCREAWRSLILTHAQITRAYKVKGLSNVKIEITSNNNENSQSPESL